MAGPELGGDQGEACVCRAARGAADVEVVGELDAGLDEDGVHDLQLRVVGEGVPGDVTSTDRTLERRWSQHGHSLLWLHFNERDS